MSKTSSSTQLSQTVLQIQPHDGINEATIEQSPPLITDERGCGNDQRVEIDGSKLEVDKEGVGDKNKVENNNNNNNNNNKNGHNNNNMCIIDVKNNNVEKKEIESNKERICRICQLEGDHLFEGVGNVVNLVHLGCSCKGDLGMSHYHCAQAWFLHKGNRICEICGKPAKNIQGIEDINCQELEADVISSIHIAMSPSPEESSNRCIKSFCNFILFVFIVAFILPWVLHPGKLS